MMENLKQYLVCLVAVSLICSVIQTLQQKGTAKELTKLICGLVVTVTMLSPFTGFDLDTLCAPVVSISGSSQVIIEDAQKNAHCTLGEIIKAETEAYIQDKATELGADIDVEVSVTDEDIPIPAEAVISGSLTAYARNRLQEILSSELGIAKENLKWIG